MSCPPTRESLFRVASRFLNRAVKRERSRRGEARFDEPLAHSREYFLCQHCFRYKDAFLDPVDELLRRLDARLRVSNVALMPNEFVIAGMQLARRIMRNIGINSDHAG